MAYDASEKRDENGKWTGGGRTGRSTSRKARRRDRPNDTPEERRAGRLEHATVPVEFKVGHSVEFHHPHPDEIDKETGKQVPMTILEMRGDRALVRHEVPSMRVKPTSVVNVSDLKHTEDAGEDDQAATRRYRRRHSPNDARWSAETKLQVQKPLDRSE